MKKTAYFLLLCFTAFFTLHSCNEDDSSQFEQNQNNTWDQKQITFSEFLKLEGSKPKVKKIQKYFQGYYTDISNKGGDDINWEIDTTKVNQIITSDQITYTFGLIEYSDSIQGFRNVIVKINGDEVQTLLVHYPEGVDFENNTSRPASGEELETSVFGKSVTCYEVIIFTVDCDDAECEYGWGLIEVPCGGGNSSGGGGGSPSGPGTPTGPIEGGFPPMDGGGPGGGGSGSTYNVFLNLLSIQQLQWLNRSENSMIRSQIYNYLQNNNYSDNAMDFALNLIDLLTELNYITPSYNSSNYPGKNDGMPFSWWKNNTYLNNNFYLGINEATMGPGYGDITTEEKILVGLFPAAALTIKNNVNPAFDMSIIKVANNGNPYQGYNDKRDAFRHSYFNAINTRDVVAQPPVLGGPPILAREIVRLFGIAHESEVPSHMIKEKIMDLHNNEVGIQFCTDCYPGVTTDNEVANGIVNFLNNGNLRYLNPLNSNNTTNANTQIIPTNQ